MKALILGSSEMIGHVVGLFLQEKGHSITGYDSTETFLFPEIMGSLYDLEKIKSIVSKGQFDAVVNCTAIINQHAEEDKAEASFINVFLPHYLEKITAGTQTIVVHRSTDCIFSGSRGSYTVNDIPDASSFYARTKAVGEINNDKDITIRTSLIGPETSKEGGGLLNWFLRQRGEVTGYTGAIWTGITTISYAKIVEKLVALRAHGLMQCVPDYSISKFGLLELFEKYFRNNREIVPVEGINADKSLVQETCGYKLDIPGYETMVSEMAEWMTVHKNIYDNIF